jgi:hypothetical protein
MENPETVCLRSNFGVEECLQRLREATDAPKSQFFPHLGPVGSKPVLAEFRGNRFKLWKRKESRNDFAPCFFGILSSEGSGSQLVGRFGMDRSIRLFIAFWLVFTVGISLATLPVMVDHLRHPKQGELSVFDFMPLGLLGAGILVFKYGRRIGNQEGPFLSDFLQKTLQARQVDSRFLA